MLYHLCPVYQFFNVRHLTDLEYSIIDPVSQLLLLLQLLFFSSDYNKRHIFSIFSRVSQLFLIFSFLFLQVISNCHFCSHSARLRVVERESSRRSCWITTSQFRTSVENDIFFCFTACPLLWKESLFL